MGPLAPSTLSAYRSAFLQDVAQGHRRQIILPQALIATLFISAFWIAIPHINRPWLYRCRWIVVALVMALNYEQVTRASSTNPGWAVVSGLMATHGTMLCLQHLVFTNPQRDAARALRVSKSDADKTHSQAQGAKPQASVTPRRPTANGTLSRPMRVDSEQNAHLSSRLCLDTYDSGGEYYYIWQPFPAQASFVQRLAWATDLMLSFRGAGWNSSISAIPRPSITTPIRGGQSIPLMSIPSSTAGGFEYISLPSAFLWHRVRLFTVAYLMLDFLGTFMMKDPYFVLGRERATGYPLPQYLANLSPWRLEAFRQLLSISGAFSAVAAGTSLIDMAHYAVTSYWAPSRNIPWMYASAFGSVGEVFDKGLGGFWGSWWHQTFRQSFLGPATFLLKTGWIRKGTLAGNAVALISTFAMSGLLHASGSLSAMPPATKLWRQPAFFLLQGVGVVLQQQLASLLRRVLPRLPCALRRAANVGFTLLWLYSTAALFNDDMAAMGVWLLEPVPISVFRGLGFGFPGDAIWRWDSSYLLRWHSGRHWWDSGFTV